MSWQFCTVSTIGQRMWTSSTDNSELLQHNIHPIYVCRVENVEMDGGNKKDRENWNRRNMNKSKCGKHK